jgi:hypothetical protein
MSGSKMSFCITAFRERPTSCITNGGAAMDGFDFDDWLEAESLITIEIESQAKDKHKNGPSPIAGFERRQNECVVRSRFMRFGWPKGPLRPVSRTEETAL